MLGDGRWRRQHPAASVGTNVVSSLLNAVAVLCFSTYLCLLPTVGDCSPTVIVCTSTSITLEQSSEHKVGLPAYISETFFALVLRYHCKNLRHFGAPNTWCRNVLGPKCLRSEVSVHPIIAQRTGAVGEVHPRVILRSGGL